MSNEASTLSAKDQVITWVRSKNPQTMELKFGCEVQTISESGFINYSTVIQCDTDKRGKPKYLLYNNEIGARWCPKQVINEILGSPLGLQELLIALGDPAYEVHGDGWIVERDAYGDPTSYAQFDFTQNLHNQPDSFYESLLPLLPND